MKIVSSFLRWFFLGTVLLGLAVFLVGVLFLKTPYGKDVLKQMAEGAFNRSFQGTLRIGRIETVGLTGLRAREVAFTLKGRSILSAHRVNTEISPLALATKRVWIPRLVLQDVFFDLARNEKGQPGIAQVFKKRQQKPGGPSDWKVRVASIQVRNATLQDASFLMNQTHISGNISVFQDDARVNIHELISKLLFRKQEHEIKASMAYSHKGRIHRLQVFPSLIRTKNSSFGIQGRIRLAPSFRMEIGLAIDRGFLKDLGHLLPLGKVSLTTPIQGGLAFKGDFKRFVVFGGVVSSENRLFGTIKADLEKGHPEVLVYFNRFDIHSEELLLPVALAAKADFRLGGAGWFVSQGPLGRPEESRAELSLDKAIVQGFQAKRLNLRLKQTGELVQLKAMALDPNAEMDFRGKVTVSGKFPFEGSLAFKGLNPNAWYSRFPKSSLVGEGHFKGNLKEGGGPDISFKASFLPRSLIADIQGIKADLRGMINPKEILLESVNLYHGSDTLSLSGRLEATKPMNADITFSLKAKDLSLVSGILGTPIQGALSSSGSISHEDGKLSLKGTLMGQKLEYRDYAMDKVDASWEGSLGKGQPKGRLLTDVEGLKAGIRVQTLHLQALGGPKLKVLLEAKESHFGGTIRLRAHGNRLKNAWNIGIDALSLQSPEASWRLARPGRLNLEPSRGFSLSKFELSDGSQKIVLEGGIVSQRMKGHMELSRVRLRPLLNLAFPNHQDLAAEMSGDFRVLGSLNDPRMTLKARIQDILMDGKGYGTLELDSSYQQGLARLEVSWPSQTTRVSLSQPMDISFMKGIRVRFKPGRRLEARSGGLTLGMFRPFTGAWLRHIAGVAKFQLLAHGDLSDQRRVEGWLRVEGGFIKVERLGAELAFDRVRLDFLGTEARLMLKARDPEGGSLDLKGKIDLWGWSRGSARLDMALLAKSLSLTRVPRYRIKADAEVALTGDASAPRLSGEVVFLRSLLNPDLGLLAKKGLTQDNTVVVHGKETQKVQDVQKGPSFWSRVIRVLRIEVSVKVGENVWVRRTDLTADLGGSIQISKEPSGPFMLKGGLEIIRGWLNVYSKRFTIERAKAKFTPATGTNPLLDIVAVYSKGDYTVYIMVHGEAKRPQIEFRSSPKLSRQDILSVLLFGKPQDELGASEQASFQAQAASASGGMIASTLLTEIRQEFGLSGLGFQIEEFSLADENGDGGRIGLGRYIGPKTYVRFYHSLNPQEGEEVAIDYHLTPKLGITGHTTSQGISGVDVFLHTQY